MAPARACECGGGLAWEVLRDDEDERWLGLCEECGWMTTFLPDVPDCIPSNPLAAFLLGPGKAPRPQSPPWIRLFRIAGDGPWNVNWLYCPLACHGCGAQVTFQANTYPQAPGGRALPPLPRLRSRVCRIPPARHHLHESPVVGEAWPASGVRARRRHDRLEPFETGGRPQSFRVVVHLERRRRVRKGDPGQLRPGEDVYVGHNARGQVERPAANEQHLRPSVLAEDRHLAGRTAEDLLLAAIVARHLDWLRVAREQLHTVGLDQQVDNECASGLPLAVQAVTAMREERIGRKPVANRSAGATTLTWDAHDLLLEAGRRSPDSTPYPPPTRSRPLDVGNGGGLSEDDGLLSSMAVSRKKSVLL
jgi:hypothetical protein